MNKIIMGFVIGAVIIVGGIVAFGKNNNDDVDTNSAAGTQETGTPYVNDTPDTSMPEGKKMAFGNLVAQGGTYECTVNQNVGDISSTGKVWIDGTRLSGEFATSIGGQNITSYMIVKDGYTYSWSSAMATMGFKMKNATQATGDTGAAASGSYSWNADTIGDYNCNAWTAVESKFSLPASVKFTEMKSQ
jgi:hypothetical protein